MPDFYQLADHGSCVTLLLQSDDPANRLCRDCVLELTSAFELLSRAPRPVIIAGNQHFFSAGADLRQIAALSGPAAYEFGKMGQALMLSIERFPAPVYAAIAGYCMGGGLDLALACHRRFASPHAIFGHRGAALGLITGWGDTQRLPRLIGRAKALEVLVTAEKIHAAEALRLGLVNDVSDDPVRAARQFISARLPR